MTNTNELIFRLAVGVVLAAWLLVRAYFGRRFGDDEKLSERHATREKISYVLVALSAVPVLLYVIGGFFSFAQFVIPEAVRWSGIFIGISGVLLFSQTHITLGKNWSGVLQISKEHELVVNGPYRFVRHPMYAAFFAMSIGILLLSANWIVGGINLLSVAYMYAVRVVDEEAMMLDEFGQQYKSYMETTGRLLPRLPT